MTNCCTSSASDRTPPRNAVCPRNGNSYSAVDLRTVLHHVRTPWQSSLPAQAYYFCDDPACDVVYFGADRRLITRADLRTDVGQKSQADDRAICYCFDVKAADLRSAEGRALTRAFVIDQTRQATCDCEVLNPSGRCCLKDFPKA